MATGQSVSMPLRKIIDPQAILSTFYPRWCRFFWDYNITHGMLPPNALYYAERFGKCTLVCEHICKKPEGCKPKKKQKFGNGHE